MFQREIHSQEERPGRQKLHPISRVWEGYGLAAAELAKYRHKRPIASHFHSGSLEFSYLGKDLDEADGEPEETLASITVRERTAEHFHDVLSGD